MLKKKNPIDSLIGNNNMICDIKGRNIDIHTVQNDSNSLGLFSFHFFFAKVND